MKPPLRGAIVLVASILAMASPAQAQPTSLCSTCLANAHCQADNEACTPACEARYFNIDPRRRDCLAQCSAARAQCEQTALKTCRETKACR
jgi:hypothetical protein